MNLPDIKPPSEFRRSGRIGLTTLRAHAPQPRVGLSVAGGHVPQSIRVRMRGDSHAGADSSDSIFHQSAANHTL